MSKTQQSYGNICSQWREVYLWGLCHILSPIQKLNFNGEINSHYQSPINWPIMYAVGIDVGI